MEDFKNGARIGFGRGAVGWGKGLREVEIILVEGGGEGLHEEGIFRLFHF